MGIGLLHYHPNTPRDTIKSDILACIDQPPSFGLVFNSCDFHLRSCLFLPPILWIMTTCIKEELGYGDRVGPSFRLRLHGSMMIAMWRG